MHARTDTRWFHKYCREAQEIRFVSGRINFIAGATRAPFPSMVVVFRPLLGFGDPQYSGGPKISFIAFEKHGQIRLI